MRYVESILTNGGAGHAQEVNCTMHLIPNVKLLW